MKIAYICNGQDINKDIELANPEALTFQIMKESAVRKKETEDHLFKNASRFKNNTAPQLSVWS